MANREKVKKIVSKILEYGHMVGSNDDLIIDADIEMFTDMLEKEING